MGLQGMQIKHGFNSWKWSNLAWNFVSSLGEAAYSSQACSAIQLLNILCVALLIC